MHMHLQEEIMFELYLGGGSIPPGRAVNQRIAVRAVIMDGDRILLVRTKKGDYKIPGGAVKLREMREEALLREVTEETGYIDVRIMEELGILVQQRPDLYEADKYFRMESHYYRCVLMDDRNVGQCLDENEKLQEIVPAFVPLKEAAASNRNLLRTDSADMYDWVERETLVLEELARQGVHREIQGAGPLNVR